jgi:hypothetical protein
MHFEPLPEPPMPTPTAEQTLTFENRVRNLPPLFGGYHWIPPAPGKADPGRYLQREGYFVFAALACFNFDGLGNLTGLIRFNRGGVNKIPPGGLVDSLGLTGTYVATPNTALGVMEGTFHTRHTNTGGLVSENDYRFFMRSADELEWAWHKGTDRAHVTHGTLNKVSYATVA